jgi:serine/threonine protein kinase
MAVKMFYFNSDQVERMDNLLNEIQVMCSLNHPNIVHYFYSERRDTCINLFMELCDASLGDCLLYPEKRKQHPFQVPALLREIVSAVSYLHGRGVVHRDIKPQNILLRGVHAKLSDFGTSKQTGVNEEDLLGTHGTFRYMAPEVYRGEPHSLSCDIWSLGCLACELFACTPTFMDLRNHFMLGELNEESVVSHIPTNCPSVIYDFVSQCLHVAPEARATAQGLLLHPLLSQDDPSVAAIPTIFDARNRSRTEAFDFSLNSNSSSESGGIVDWGLSDNNNADEGTPAQRAVLVNSDLDHDGDGGLAESTGSAAAEESATKFFRSSGWGSNMSVVHGHSITQVPPTILARARMAELGTASSGDYPATDGPFSL